MTTMEFVILIFVLLVIDINIVQVFKQLQENHKMLWAIKQTLNKNGEDR